MFIIFVKHDTIKLNKYSLEMSIVQNINGKAMNQEQIQQYFYKLQLNEFKPDVNLLTLKKNTVRSSALYTL